MSLNDPRWGNQGNDQERDRPKDGPPDLDELWRDVNRRLGGLFGRRSGGGGNGNGGGGGGMPSLSPRQFGGGLGALIVLVLLVWGASGFYIVDANQRGVVLRFGEYNETTEPGLHLRLPFPIESHELVDVTGVRTIEVGYRGAERNKVLREALMLTDDENIINIQFAVQYILKSPEDYLFNNRHPDEAVAQAAETAVRQIVGRNRMDFVLYEGREEIAVRAKDLMQEIVDRYQTGIQISQVTMRNAQPPEQVQAAFDDAVKAGQDRVRQTNEGQAYANDVIPKARGTASRLAEEASGYAARVVANAEGEASRFSQVLAEYRKAPKVTRDRMYIETMQDMYSNTTKVMVDTKGSGNLMLMPLDKLIQSSGASEAARAEARNTTSVVAGTETPRSASIGDDVRSRDFLRNSRELGGR
ncbi:MULTISPECIES: FtsH protease activity modulator HflK [Denitromonas]|uniref:Protein HflK n=2 Tax=Denitromonas TaxID=139331 RepID=A0A558CJN3_9RHOO|nr:MULTISPECIES: FtsH protease activity modulator HflK [Denitromonas]TVO50907.1 FtsH protease activity modulator HflK [Denitromonas halophila]TVO62926.1 FtsH protease activity modulator HflK [Denitromonas ohlonensis]TVO74957.1 FtsH protease activity modulator HflK [Denitromonas ohlonensis]TVT48966.1 MAG: FtsH protease activity modulator HflK [Denitromonas halophila]TVT72054.1 MAG: FtsH protease activity modulator HflK [Denitromonas halophila]